MSEGYLSEMFSDKCQEIEVSQSVKFLDPFCPDLNSSDLPSAVLQDIDLHLECDDDGNFSMPAEASNKSVLSHSVIGHNVNLRVSFPVPKSCSEDTDPILQCSHCDSKFKRQNKLAKHLLEIHKIVKNYLCSDCSFATTSLRMLRRHCSRKHIQDKQKGNRSGSSAPIHSDNCPSQDQADVISKDVSLHSSDHFEDLLDTASKSSDLLLNSSNESEIMRSEDDMDDSILTKTKESKSTAAKYIYMCTKCPYKASTKHNLQLHATNIHDPDRKIFKCDDCDYTCKQKRSLNIHQKTHKGENSLKCDVCPKQFLSISALKRHAHCHLKGRDFVCSFENCGKEFKNIHSLQSHKYKVHKKCKTKDPSVGSPQDEQLRKEGDKLKKSAFVCTWVGCGKSFRDNYNLKAHLCCHTGEKPVKCPHCVFRCAQKASLSLHIKKMHT